MAALCCCGFFPDSLFMALPVDNDSLLPTAEQCLWFRMEVSPEQMRPPELVIVMLGFLMEKMHHNCKASIHHHLKKSRRVELPFWSSRVRSDKQRTSRLAHCKKRTEEDKATYVARGLFSTLIVEKLSGSTSDCCRRTTRR